MENHDTNIAFRITDAASAVAAIETLTYVAAGLDAAFPARAILAALPATPDAKDTGPRE